MKDNQSTQNIQAKPGSNRVVTENGEFDTRTFYGAISSRRGIARVCETASAALTALGVPPKRRGVIIELIGMSRGSLEWFDFTMFDLGRRLFGFDDTLTGEERERRIRNISDQARRELKKIIEWEHEAGTTAMEYIPGTKAAGDEHIPSKARLPILKIVQDTFREFPALARAKTPRAIEKAAKIVAERCGADLKQPPKRARETVISPERYRKQALSIGDKYAEEFGDKATAYETLAKEFMKRSNAAKCGNSNTKRHFSESAIDVDTTGYKKSRSTNLSQTFGDKEAVGAQEQEAGNAFSAEHTATAEYESPEGDADAISSLSSDSLVECSKTFEVSRAFEAFASVDAQPDQILLIDDTVPDKSEALMQQHKGDFGEIIKLWLDWQECALYNQWSTVLRMRGPVLQLDDCERALIELLKPYAFVTVETSPDNFQAWLAFKDDEDKAAAKDRLFAGLRQILPDTKVNIGGSGSLRWPGTVNFKPSRRSPDGSYPVVRLESVQLGRVVTPTGLDELGLLAVEDKPETDAQVQIGNGVWWPSYDIAYQRAPMRANEQVTDASRADASFVTLALIAGHSPKAIKQQLVKVSKHRQTADYAELTVNNVATWLSERNSQEVKI